MAVAAVVALTAVNLRGVAKTVRLTRLLVAVVVATLAFVVVAALLGGTASAAGLRSTVGVGPYDVLQSAGLLFFAFAGYARIATLGEEVRDPERTIPRAIPLALGIVLVVYALVAVSALAAVGPGVLAASKAPLASVIAAGELSAFTPLVRLGGTVAALAVLLSLLVGVSRTTFAMAREGELPRWLDAVHPVHKVPHHAELAVAVAVVALVLVVDLRGAIGFSSFAVLTYYAVTNASALTLRLDQRRYPPVVAIVGLIGCVVLAATLPLASVLTGLVVIGAGAVVFLVRQQRAA